MHELARVAEPTKPSLLVILANVRSIVPPVKQSYDLLKWIPGPVIAEVLEELVRYLLKLVISN